MSWNSDEDLVLVTAEGRIIIIDVYLGRKIGDHMLSGFLDKLNQIEEGRIQAWQPKAPVRKNRSSVTR